MEETEVSSDTNDNSEDDKIVTRSNSSPNLADTSLPIISEIDHGNKLLEIRQLSNEERTAVIEQQNKFTIKQVLVYERLITERDEEIKFLKTKNEDLTSANKIYNAEFTVLKTSMKELEGKVNNLNKDLYEKNDLISQMEMNIVSTNDTELTKLTTDLNFMHDKYDELTESFNCQKVTLSKEWEKKLVAINLKHENDLSAMNYKHTVNSKALQRRVDESDVLQNIRDDQELLLKKKDEELEILSNQRKSTDKNLADKDLILTKCEVINKVKDELLESKREIIENLRFHISSLKKEHSSNNIDIKNLALNDSVRKEETTKESAPKNVLQEKMIEITKHYDEKIKLMKIDVETLKSQLSSSNNDLNDKIVELSDVREKYNMKYLEFEESKEKMTTFEEKTTGLRKIINEEKTPIYNYVLAWLSTQLDMTHENYIFEKCSTHFLPEEIDQAKSALFDTCGGEDTIIGSKENRKGGVKESKIVKDCKDLVEAMKKIKNADDDNDNQLLFLTSADGIMKCPNNVPMSCSVRDEMVGNKVSELEKSFSTFIAEQRKQTDRINGKLETALKDNASKNMNVGQQINEFNASLNGFSSEIQLLKQQGQQTYAQIADLKQTVPVSCMGLNHPPTQTKAVNFQNEKQLSPFPTSVHSYVGPKAVSFQGENSTQVFNRHDPAMFVSKMDYQNPQQSAVSGFGNNAPQFEHQSSQAPTIYSQRVNSTPPGVLNVRPLIQNTNTESVNNTITRNNGFNQIQAHGFMQQVTSSDVDLALSRVQKGVTPDSIKSYAQQKGIDVKSCVLLTKWDKAQSHTFKVTVGVQHAEKAFMDSVWPPGVIARQFQQRRNLRNQERRTENGEAQVNNIGAPSINNNQFNGNCYERLYIPEVGMFASSS